MDCSELIADRIKDAYAKKTSLRVSAGDTKKFLGRHSEGVRLDVSSHAGVLSYEPTELVLTARAGTLISHIQRTLRRSGQCLPFEPPNFNACATIGGTVASGLSGPSRPYVGSLRDFVLGITCVNGRGEILRFGGQVMKNVAGYDISRLFTGAMGTLGVILDVSLKVLPEAVTEQTRVYEVSENQAIEKMIKWSALPLPITGACYFNNELRIRFSGSEAGVSLAAHDLGGAEDANGDAFWHSLREFEHSFFDTEILWRFAVPQATPPLALSGECFIDWGGAQRWIASDQADDLLRTKAEHVGGHATRFWGGDRTAAIFHPLGPELQQLHLNLKKAFDPGGILNPGRLNGDF